MSGSLPANGNDVGQLVYAVMPRCAPLGAEFGPPVSRCWILCLHTCIDYVRDQGGLIVFCLACQTAKRLRSSGRMAMHRLCQTIGNMGMIVRGRRTIRLDGCKSARPVRHAVGSSQSSTSAAMLEPAQPSSISGSAYAPCMLAPYERLGRPGHLPIETSARGCAARNPCSRTLTGAASRVRHSCAGE